MDEAIERRLLSDRGLSLAAGGDLASRAHALLEQQEETWPMFRQSYAALDRVQTRTIDMGDFPVRVQWNPARIVSSSANVDPAAIRARKCFLCVANLPDEQRGLLYGSSYIVLGNPFPIFREHLTIPHSTHTPQRIDEPFGTMLDLARAMQRRYLVTYNGPRSGASAPDHLHFQAGEKGFMPLEGDLERLETGGAGLSIAGGVKLTAVEAQVRRFFVLRGAEREPLVRAFLKLLAALGSVLGEKEEPMVNVLASFENGVWTVIVFPRARHRPSAYFAEGDEKILLSPAAIDCGGVLTTPLEKDFEKLTAEKIREIFGEIFIPHEAFASACALVPGR
ncbi:MAG TPA: DUF4922 domain-containing protein [Bacteroidota bacterium]|nr:DUF4922 domain-containing protein [Bacteroidota bacterium]